MSRVPRSASDDSGHPPMPRGWGWLWSSRHFQQAGIPADNWAARTHPRTFLRVLVKTMRRALLMRALGQGGRERDVIDASVQDILWINLSAGSIGDSIMDLSGRVLLAAPGRRIDLLTHPRNADLYRHDAVFDQTFTEVPAAAERHRRQPYQMVIIDAYGTQGLRAKRAIAPDAPFAGMWGFVNGYEIHRTIFSFRRIAALTRQTIHLPLLPSLNAAQWSLPSGVALPPEGSIAIVVGGEWDFRTYRHWPVVARALARRHPLVLLGSSNGKAHAQQVMQALQEGESTAPHCIDLVGRLTLTETAVALARCRAMVCADGGLWHVGCALGVPSVVLFADTRLFDAHGRHVCRDTDDLRAEALHHWTAVSEIAPEEVLAAFERL